MLLKLVPCLSSVPKLPARSKGTTVQIAYCMYAGSLTMFAIVLLVALVLGHVVAGSLIERPDP